MQIKTGILGKPLANCNRYKINSMKHDDRSTCPISTGLELLGDRWTLLVIRDLMFAGKRHFREFLQSEEAISSNVLADRLNSLVESGIVTKNGDPTHAQKAVYSLTEKGLELLPVLVAMSAWTQKHFPKTRRPEAVQLVQGGIKFLKQLERRLRLEHGIS
ncbi:helix-turn-helix domain-containing protein [Variovorax sp. J22P240]|uniref:winged helix-turn-helix transcriptional regulator n=2 Tax=unclassified Variovorax TaxID=663243 RepID=UPI002575F92F|nr:helix-turn-helix domain-containing protein [Variovorax sp. J22R115]MDM0002123.1 helix-turn-helix domain-containing protein [Variovorax sp. J22P240]MDM0052428.1 helix-turn-helix domain-containing protein [Variovorax sp. J22R115]